MSINRYTMWSAHADRVTAETHEDDPNSPHIHLFYKDNRAETFRASINVKSTAAISELALFKNENFIHPIIAKLKQFELGMHRIDSTPDTVALDYIRGNLLDLTDGILLPHDVPGVENDLLDIVMPVLQRAVNKKSKIYLFGEPYSDNKGIHDVHMNQGSAGSFKKYNGIWQDGGVIIEDADTGRYIAIFLAFGSQAAHTDEEAGNPLPGSQLIAELLGHTRPDIEPEIPPRPDPDVLISDDLRVAIIAALVNPEGGENQPGHTGRPELVYLLNRSTEGISLKGWQLLNKADTPHVLSGDIWLAPGEVRCVAPSNAPLSNKGGLITLLDDKGMKVDGVSYTKQQANEGEIVLFRS